MTTRFARLLPVLVLCGLVVRSSAQTPPPLPTNQPGALAAATPGANEELVQVKLPDADLETIISALEIYTGRVATLRPAALPTATYNLQFSRPVPKSEAILAIETVLSLNGIGVVPLGEKFLKIVPLQQTRVEAPETITGTTLDRPPSGRAASKVFQLEFLRVGEVVPLLQGMLNPTYGGPVQLPNANAALITDSVSNLQRVELLLQQLDKPVGAGMRPKFYQLQNGAKASDVVQKLRTILTGTLQVQLGQATTYSADDRTNQIILVTDPRQYPFFDDLIAKLDIRADPNTRNDVIYLNHAKAVDVVNVLSRIISQQTAALQRQNPQSVRPGQGTPAQPAAPNAPAAPGAAPAALPGPTAAIDSIVGGASNEFSSIMTVVNDDRSNSVVVSGTADDIRLIKEMIAKLDIVLAQVRIEVVIAEVTLEDNHESGISALGLKIDGDKLVGFSGAATGVAVANGVVTRPGKTGNWDLATEIAINTTPRKGNNSITSRPAVVTSHGKPGNIFYGETRPVIVGSTTIPGGTVGGGITQSSQVQQQAIGTNLTVTPFIGQDGSVQLDIVQDVSDVTGNVTVDGNTQYIIGQRKSTSYVSAKSGDILVLGGFQKNSDISSTSRLGPIPILGDLFGTRTKNKKRQELIFFLRPVVLTNDPARDNAEAMKQVEGMPMREEIKHELDPKHPLPEKTMLDKILPKL
jgi:general secretion pathway protein D